MVKINIRNYCKKKRKKRKEKKILIVVRLWDYLVHKNLLLYAATYDGC